MFVLVPDNGGEDITADSGGHALHRHWCSHLFTTRLARREVVLDGMFSLASLVRMLRGLESLLADLGGLDSSLTHSFVRQRRQGPSRWIVDIGKL